MKLYFCLQIGWVAEGLKSQTEFFDIDLGQKDWVEYDEAAATNVEIHDLEYEFVRERG